MLVFVPPTRRSWIAQKYFYSQSVEFFYGTETVDGSKLLQVLNNLSLYSFSGPEPPGYKEEEALFLGFQALTDLSKVKEMHRGVNKLSFFDVVMLGRGLGMGVHFIWSY